MGSVGLGSIGFLSTNGTLWMVRKATRHRQAIALCASFCFYFIHFSRRLFVTTLTLEKAISAEAHMGVICHERPKT